MHKRAIVTAICLLVAIFAVAGCGGDAGRAKDYMNKGDAEVVKLKPVSDRFTKSVSALFSGVFAGGKVDAASFQKDAAGVKTLADQLSAGAREAAKQYALIDGLKDVPSYRKYADLEQKVMSLKAFLDKWSAAISSPTFDPVAFVGAAKDFSAQADTASKEIEKLEKEAASLKKSQKL
jgi:hypothetical protein